MSKIIAILLTISTIDVFAQAIPLVHDGDNLRIGTLISAWDKEPDKFGSTKNIDVFLESGFVTTIDRQTGTILPVANIVWSELGCTGIPFVSSDSRGKQFLFGNPNDINSYRLFTSTWITEDVTIFVRSLYFPDGTCVDRPETLPNLSRVTEISTENLHFDLPLTAGYKPFLKLNPAFIDNLFCTGFENCPFNRNSF